MNITEKVEAIYGPISLSEEEIISFAQTFDPLPFHTSIEAAKNSSFGELVASGPHLFLKFYKAEFISRYGSSILAGLEINNWKFIRPVTANLESWVSVTPIKVKKNPERKYQTVTWAMAFKNAKHEVLQQLSMTILHKL